jgi:hypothetical protein
MAYSVSWLSGSEAASLRKARIAGNTTHIVWAEVAPGEMVELDAQSEQHARKLAHDWLRRGAAISASARPVRRDGTVKKSLGVWDDRHLDEMVA